MSEKTPRSRRVRPRGNPWLRGFLWFLALPFLLLPGAIAVWSWTRPPELEAAPRELVPSAPPAPSVSAPPAPSASAAPAPPREPYIEIDGGTLEEQKAVLLRNMERELRLNATQMAAMREFFEASRALGQGNPEVTTHPMTRAECRAIREAHPELPAGDPRCGAPNMVPLYDPSAGQKPEDATACIDQYEFPNIACEYPVIYARADEAVDICRALDKRICDAHEWEGGCAGAVKPAEKEYAFGQRRMMIEHLHNEARDIVWAYGPKKDHAKCATGSKKNRGCTAGGWELCGSNTYPAGAFPECRSPLGVFDQHGNAAEHMNLPLKPEQLASRGGLGETEMKGSWFIFSSTEAHIDDCRWRAPMWHKTRIHDKNSHRNYHLGFRCCKDIGPAPAGAKDAGAP